MMRATRDDLLQRTQHLTEQIEAVDLFLRSGGVTMR